ncbi:Zinc finger C2H2 superfamily [Arabidopsis suecica]|uniref:Zinc finger C2H2 superfamily n=1 Tax=Arabidopsis suecica TaxID=45249 RepID=A0A8T2AI12_ARASU|nr:Zinc finger C2H2 superfamily [Arabidopsis suecica]
MKRTRDLYEDDDSSSSSESEEFHRTKLPVKVKLPEERSEDEDESPQPLRKHFCVICEKQFSSGKAYGGHVRIHSTEYNIKGKMKKTRMRIKKKKRKIGLLKKEKEKEIDLIRADVEGKIRCCLCGKEFQTMHSLFGHMRRHPDRSWKGIRPPPPPEKFNLSYLGDDDVDDDDDDDEDDDVMSRSMMNDVPEDVQEAACILMMLSYASSNYWAGIKKATESPKSEVRSPSCYKDDKEKDEVLGDGGMDDKKSLIVDMNIKMEVNSPRDEAKRSLGFDLNQPPYHEDHPDDSCWD